LLRGTEGETTIKTYQEHRPTTFEGIYGQDTVVFSLKQFLRDGNLPRAILFSGPPGCGKTSLGRILASELGVTQMGLSEINFASARGIDVARDIEQASKVMPMSGKNRMFLIDEAHQATAQAEQALLKLLEDPPPHVYFVLCTSEPEKLSRAMATRLTVFTLSLLSPDQIRGVIRDLDPEAPQNAITAVVEASGGSARAAIVLLNQLHAAGYTDEAITQFTRVSGGETAEYKNLVADIVTGGPGKWNSVYTAIRATPKDELERLRWAILGYAAAVMKDSGKSDKCVRVILLFESPFFQSGVPGFLAAAYRAIHLK